MSARARIDEIQIAYWKPRSLLPVVEDQEFDNEDDLGDARSNVITFTDENLTKVMRSIRAGIG
ncbi:hypothetical protein QO034_15790 [Sedimentitalea sp. JM2-8]|uniref:Uncharacterized protein n=1 Tax=Sedimentitalea xiamensis TaxID=3050037 RepID=A0ABT7FHE5_9RHOB|nr:hypothetical protein [Sedimentitalea xiamensis]MDK3074560.1 hypothetical protein [Sedimentitalea xiamensis]